MHAEGSALGVTIPVTGPASVGGQCDVGGLRRSGVTAACAHPHWVPCHG